MLTRGRCVCAPSPICAPGPRAQGCEQAKIGLCSRLVLVPGAIIDPEDLRIPGEQPGTPMVVLEDLGEVPHGHRFRARQGKSLLLITVLVPDVTMQRELRDLLSYQIIQAGEVVHPNLLPTYGAVPLPLGDDGLETLFVVRPDPGCPSLRQWLHEVWNAGHVLDPLNAVAIAVQICEALGALHHKFAHGYVTPDNVMMYPTGGMPQALLSGTAEGALLPFCPGFDRFKEAGFLPQAGRELFESPYEPRVETDVLGVAALVMEILTGQPLQPGMPLDRVNLPPRLKQMIEVASRPDPEDRPQDILMFSRRLQAAVGLGEDPVEPSAVLEPAHHGDHADPKYPAVRAKPWRPPPPAAPPWAEQQAANPTPGSGAWNIGAPTPGSGAWTIPGTTPGSGAWNIGAPTPGSGAWNLGAQPVAPAPSAPTVAPLVPPPVTPPSVAPPSPVPPPVAPPSPVPPPVAPSMTPPSPAPALGESFPSSATAEAMELPRFDDVPAAPPARPAARTQHFGGAPPPPGSSSLAPPPPIPAGVSFPAPPPVTTTSVSIVMPAPDGSMMAPLLQGQANFIILRRGKRHGPYDLAQLQKLIPMGKLRSVDSIELVSSSERVLAVDIPGLRPAFEVKARENEQAARAAPRPVTGPSPVVPPEPGGRNALWVVIGLMALALIGAAAFLAIK